MRLRNPLPPLPPIQAPAWRERTLFGLLLVATFLECWKPVSDPDTYWHLAIGREIWKTGHLVRTETFSFTDAGAPWLDFEWLFHVWAYPLFKIGGETGLTVLTALFGALGVGLAYRSVRLCGGNSVGLALFTLPLLWAYSERVRFRPELVSVILFAILLETLIRWRGRAFSAGGERWLLPSLFFVWIQVHGAWAYGGVLATAFLAGAVGDAWKANGTFPKDLALRFGTVGVTCLGVLFLNPFGWDLPLLPIRVLASFSDSQFVPIAEWARTPFQGMFIPYLAACTATVAAILLMRARFSWAEFLLAASQLALGLYWVRYAAFAAVALSPSAASRLALFRRPKWTEAALACLAAAGLVGAIGLRLPTLAMPSNPEERYPVRECAFLRTELPGGNLLHEFRVGGFLEWTLPGTFKVFMDGRFPLFQAAATDYYQAHRTPATFRAFLGKYLIDAVLYDYQGFQLVPAGGGRPRGPSAVLFPAADWALVHFGPYGMVFLKRRSDCQAIIGKFEYTILRPDDLPYLLWAADRGSVSKDVLKAEVERSLQTTLPPALTMALRAAGDRLRRDGVTNHAP